MVAAIAGIVGWGVLLGALVLWEVGAVVFRYPRFSGMVRYVTHWQLVRYVFFGFWLWLGWHLFIRGWHFFIRGRV